MAEVGPYWLTDTSSKGCQDYSRLKTLFPDTNLSFLTFSLPRASGVI